MAKEIGETAHVGGRRKGTRETNTGSGNGGAFNFGAKFAVDDPETQSQTPARDHKTVRFAHRKGSLVTRWFEDADLDSSGLVSIRVNNWQLRDIEAEAWEVLTYFNDYEPFLFQRDHKLVEIVTDNLGRLTIRNVTKDRLKLLLSREANFQRGKKKRAGVSPTRELVRAMMADHPLPVPTLLGVISAPIYDSTDKLDTEPGYQEGTRCYLHLADGLGRGSIADAVRLIDE